VRGWFDSGEREAWATCPLTENGLVRIIGHENYREFPGGTNEARLLLAVLTGAPGHQFWADDLSLADGALFSRLPASNHLTDCYLLALAVKRGGRLATLDERIDADLIPGGPRAYFVIP
jgi:predicted nucleic acid-binding protein